MAQKHVSELRLREKRQRQRQRKREAAAAAAAAAAEAAAAALAAAAGGGGVVNHFSTSLYVGDLDRNVTDEDLYLFFAQVGAVDTVKVCKDLSTDTPRSLGYSYVNYFCPQDAERAMEILNFALVRGKPISVMYSRANLSLSRSGAANIFIKNLDKGIDSKALHKTFSSFGKILTWKIATDPSGQSEGYAFVQFDNDESAQTAIDKLNGMLINDKQVYVGHFHGKQEKFNNVYVKNLSESTTEEDLEKIFGEYGTITSVVVKRDGNGKSKCFGFVNFENADDVANAIEALNGKKVDDKEWYVEKAQKKSERELELKSRFEQTAKEAVDKFQGVNLYFRNLDDSIDDDKVKELFYDKVKELFSEFGTITSYKVMRAPSGVSRCSGFVAFSTPEEASRALAEMNGKMVVRKPFYVALAPRKEERRAKLQIQVQHVPGPNGVAAAAAGGGVVNQFVTTSLYVGDLDFNVTDSQLYDLFNQVAQVVSVRVCRDLSTSNRRSLGYGYVNYSNPQDAARAMEELNFTPLNGKTIRIMYSHRDPSVRKSGAENIFIKNLDKAIDNKALHDTFSTFGNILSCKIATDPSGQSKGYGFVQFDNDESAQTAIDKLNGMLINDKQVYVGHFLRKQERETALNRTKFNNVYVKNLAESTTEEDLEKIFGEYGPITSVVVMRDGNGKSRCFGFVNFENADDAANAVEALNGKKVDEKEWYVGKAQKKSERELELKSRFEQTAKEAVDKFQGVNLYVKNLDDSIDDDKLKELFSEFGTIASCKVMHDPSGVSRGSGFVAFSTPEEASRALAEMNGKMVVSKPLYVALAQRKEERRAKLQAQFSQMRPVAMAPTLAPRMPMYPPGAPGLGQQLFYGQAPPAIIPPQAGFGYQQQLVPGMRPGGAPMPNFFVPMVQQGQRPGGRRGAGPVQQAQQPMPLMQQQMLPRGRVYRYPPGRNMGDVPMPGLAGGMLSVPYDMGGMLPRDAAFGQPMPVPALATALANASPAQQRTMLGENLYPLVDQLEHEYAAKVTGMLLEMDQTEVLHLLESPEALKAKVAEAMDVLRNVAAQQQATSPADHLASLSLNDNLVS